VVVIVATFFAPLGLVISFGGCLGLVGHFPEKGHAKPPKQFNLDFHNRLPVDRNLEKLQFFHIAFFLGGKIFLEKALAEISPFMLGKGRVYFR
jgi:hypothetical protein